MDLCMKFKICFWRDVKIWIYHEILDLFLRDVKRCICMKDFRSIFVEIWKDVFMHEISCRSTISNNDLTLDLYMLINNKQNPRPIMWIKIGKESMQWTSHRYDYVKNGIKKHMLYKTLNNTKLHMPELIL